MATIHLRAPLLALLTPLLLASVACRDTIETPQALAFGTYELTLVNGDSLPVQTGEIEGILYSVLAGTILAKNDQTCEFRHTFRLVTLETQLTRVESESDPCTWQLINQSFHVRFTSNGSLLSGVLAQNALWFDFPSEDGTGFRFMYQKVSDSTH